MKFYCKQCKKTIIRDMRLKMNKDRMTTKGYKSYCPDTHRDVYLKHVSSYTKQIYEKIAENNREIAENNLTIIYKVYGNRI